MITFTCCIGNCKHILQMKPRIITNHIHKYHQQAVKQLNCNYIYYCVECDTFTSYIHYHCSDCESYFNSKQAFNTHYALYHKLWFLENDCINGQDCKKQVCKYNHYMYEQNYFVEKRDYIPQSICEYDLPWINIRCNNNKCNKDHFRERK